ncbi:MAG TPA: sulfatase [Opitutaceae bacterium]
MLRPPLPLVPALVLAVAAGVGASPPPNVLFVVIDDLNDWTELHDAAAPIKLPHLTRLAQRGVFFTHAYASSPACNPSRAAVLTGRSPASSGVYGNSTDWRGAMPHTVTLPAHFKAHGYRSVGAGKIFHHGWNNAFHDATSFGEFQLLAPDRYPPRRLNQLTAINANFDWGAWPPDERDLPDVKTADWAVDFLRRPAGGPFFLAVGIYRPHSPHFAPARHFRNHPLDTLALPEWNPDDAVDLPAGARALLDGDIWMKHFAAEAAHPGSREHAIQAYQACATFADEQIGRVLAALERHPQGANTIIVVWSDHGFQLGEKGKWEKFTLWEKATHVPLIIVAPGVSRTAARCSQPVSLLDLYPTLNELCGLPAPAGGVEGESLVPLLRDPAATRDRPAIMTYGRGNHAVRDARWRYIRYADGTEELYDHAVDALEWTNLADRPEYAAIKSGLGRWLPSTDAPAFRDLPRPRGAKAATATAPSP